jgi:hypothetical protein
LKHSDKAWCDIENNFALDPAAQITVLDLS